MFLSSKKACLLLGIHPNTLRKYANSGKIKIFKTQSGQRKYDVEEYLGTKSKSETICYCRVSSPKQKDDLERQIAFMQSNYPEAKIIKDIGSGLNFKRKGLQTLLERAINGDKLTIIVAHKDRLCRFGFDLCKQIIERSGGKIVVLDQSILSPESELTKDLLNILHVFSCRMHGLRNYKNQVSKTLSEQTTKENINEMD